MARGKVTFDTMDMIDLQKSADYHQPDYSSQKNVDAPSVPHSPGSKEKFSELDPLAKINKAFDVDDSLVVKSSTMSLRSEGRSYDSADSSWKTHENKIKNERQAKLVPELKKNYDKTAKDLNLEKGEHALTKRDASNSAKAYGVESQKNFALRKKLNKMEGKLTKGKIGVATAIPLVAAGVYGAYKRGQKNPETKGFSNLDDSLVVKYFDPARGEVPIQQNLFQGKKKVVAGPGEVFTDTSRMKEKPTTVKPNIDVTKLSTEAKLAGQSGNPRGLMRAGINKFRNLSKRGKIGVGLAAAGTIYGGSKLFGNTEKGLASSAINLVKDPKKLKEAAITAAATGATGYGIIKETPGEAAGVITRGFKIDRFKAPAIALGAGIVGGDIANRLQDNRTKRTRNGMVTEIVEQLKKKE